MTQVWRINLKPAANQNMDPREFAIQKGYVGIGWPVETDSIPDWETYKQLGKEKYKGYKGWWKGVNVLKNRMKVGDLCWTRDKQGNYYLGRITGNWEYQTGQSFKDADIINTRKCDWIKVGTVDHVPGRVVRSFIPPSTVQRINSKTILEFSKFLYNQEKGETIFQLKQNMTDIFSLISADDCEDVVGIYLQVKHNYILIPSSCKKSTMTYEYVLIHRDTQKPAIVQVKNGNVSLNRDDYSTDQDVFLFTTNGNYYGGPKANIHCLEPEMIRDFIYSHAHLMPKKVKVWVDFVKESVHT